MRILVVSQYFWPENFRINELVEHLLARGHEVTVLTGRPNYPDGVIYPDYTEQPEAFSRYGRANVVRIPLHPRGKSKFSLSRNYASFVFWASLLGSWRLRKHCFDAIFVYEISPVTVALPALLIGKLKRAPVLMWVLDLWPETLASVGVVRSERALRVIGKLVGFIYRHCDKILVQSKSFPQNILKWADVSHAIEYFPAWGDGVFDGIDQVQPASELVAFAGCFRILFAGNIGDAQDFPAILAAADLLRAEKHIRWLIVGDGRAAETVKDLIVKMELQDTVVMLGRHPLERMPSFFKAADALLVSLRADPIFSMTIPGKVQSYLSAGVPILGMLDGEGARVIEESGGGFVAGAGQSKVLADNIRKLAHLPPTDRKAMGLRATAYGQREFDRAALFDKLEFWINDARQAQRQ